MNNNNDNNEPVVLLSEKFKALLEELRTIDRVSDYTTAGFVQERDIGTGEKNIQNRSRGGGIIRQIRMRYDKRITKIAVKIIID